MNDDRLTEFAQAHLAKRGSRELDAAIRGAAGLAPPAEAHPAGAITDDDDAFAREAKTLGVAGDLVDVARSLISNADELSGAALRSALAKAIAERPGLATAAPLVTRPEGLDGGQRSPRSSEPSGTSMDAIIRGRAGRGPMPTRQFTNGLFG